MTRINLVPPSELTDQHLMAECREIRMLCSMLTRTLNSKAGYVKDKVPAKFTLNKGHVYFFYPKGKYIHKRYELICQEMKARGFKANIPFPVDKWPEHLYNDWQPDDEALEIIRERIKSKKDLKLSWYRYYGSRL